MGKILTFGAKQCYKLKNIIKILYIITFNFHCVPLQVKVIDFIFYLTLVQLVKNIIRQNI